MESKKLYYFRKAVQSGNMVEVFEYENAVSTKRSTHPNYVQPVGRSHTAADYETKIKYRQETLKRTRKRLERLLHANAYRWKDEQGKTFMPTLFTVTFKENVQDVQEAHKLFGQFVQRLNYHVYKEKVSKLKYVAVIEFQDQDRGAIHFHSVFFNLPYIEGEILSEKWGQGQIHVRSVRYRDVGRVANYLTKSLKKVDERLLGQKVYKKSRGLLEAVTMIDDWQIDKILKESELTYHYYFENEVLGKIFYQRRKIKRFKKRK